MKNFTKFLCALLVCALILGNFTSCKKIKNRITKLEQQVEETNKNIEAMQAIMIAMQNEDRILTIEKINKVGYIIVFTSGKIVTIYQDSNYSDDTPTFGVKQDSQNNNYLTVNGSWMLDEEGNKIPQNENSQFGVKQDTDGKYYWTINGEWMYDALGKRIEETTVNSSDNGSSVETSAPVIAIKEDSDGKKYWTVDGEWVLSGGEKVLAEATTPKLGIEEGTDGNYYWTIDGDWLLNDGKKVLAANKEVDEVTKAATINRVTQDEDNVYFTMGDGSIIKISKESDSNSGNTINFENGAIQATFSVSATNLIYFSQGNLQYQASTNTWRFSEHQYDTIGADNKNISSSYNGWIDLFGWGTSGWNSGANAYQPYSTSTDYKDYAPGGSVSNNLTGDYANADWGVYNAISNGGNSVGIWRTLSLVEWTYVLSERLGASSLKGLATVNGVAGLILLPDHWIMPDGVTFKSGINGYDNNTYTSSEWSKMESNGAVFLPAAGSRNGTKVSNVCSKGDYWASTKGGSGNGYMYFNSDNAATNNRTTYPSTYFGNIGSSVRLVRDL